MKTGNYSISRVAEVSTEILVPKFFDIIKSDSLSEHQSTSLTVLGRCRGTSLRKTTEGLRDSTTPV